MTPQPHLDHHPPEPPRGRQPVFNLPRIVVAVIVVCVLIQLVRDYVLTVQQHFGVILYGAFIPARYSGAYPLDLAAFTSPFTSSLLHAGWMHLGINMVWLAAFASPLATRIGAVRFVLFWCFITAGSLLLHYLARPDDLVPVVGASGAISGMMGAAALFGFRADRGAPVPIFAGRRLSLLQTFTDRQVVVFLGVWIAINVAAGAGLDLSGSEGSIAWEAHIGGLLTGLFALPLFDRRVPFRP